MRKRGNVKMKKFKILIFMMAAVLLLTSCGGGLSKKTAEQSFKAYISLLGMELKSIEIEEISELSEQIYRARVKMKIEEDGLLYAGNAAIHYVKEDKDYSVDSYLWDRDYTVTPVSGASMELIKEEIAGLALGRNCYIQKDDIKAVEFQERNTDLENLRDEMICKVVLENDIATCEGLITLKFKFGDRSWYTTMAERTNEDDFKITYIKGFEPPVPSENLILSEFLTDWTPSIRKEEFIDNIEVEEPVPYYDGYYTQFGYNTEVPVKVMFCSDIVDVECSMSFRYYYKNGKGWEMEDPRWSSYMKASYDYTKMIGTHWVGEWRHNMVFGTSSDVDFIITGIEDEKMICEGSIGDSTGKFYAYVKEGGYFCIEPITVSINSYIAQGSMHIDFEEGYLYQENLFDDGRAPQDIRRVA